MSEVAPGPGQETWALLPAFQEDLRWGAFATEERLLVWLEPRPAVEGQAGVDALVGDVTLALASEGGMPAIALFRRRIGFVHAVRFFRAPKPPVPLPEVEGAWVAGSADRARNAVVAALGFAGACWPEWGALLTGEVLDGVAGAADVPEPSVGHALPVGEA